MALPDQIELLKLFSSFLFEARLSTVSVKNYLSDLRHFLNFCSTPRSFSEVGPTVKDIFHHLDRFLDPYLDHQKASFTPASTTARRLASIRRFSTFLSVKFNITNIFTAQTPSPSVTLANAGVHTPSGSPRVTLANEGRWSPKGEVHPLSTAKLLDQFKTYLEKENKSHSTVKNYLSDLNHFFLWTANETPFTDQNLVNILSLHLLQSYVTYLKLCHTSTSVINRRQSSIKKLTKFCFEEGFLPENPFELKPVPQTLSPLAWLERFTHKKAKESSATKGLPAGRQGRLAIIYERYSSLRWTPYFNLALLILATTAMAIFAYNQIISQARPGSAATSLTPPKRQLSFQGRLTDSGGTPITTAVSVVFKLFNQLAPPGTQLYTTGTCSITPDQDGIFNSLIGDTVCGAEIPSSVFTDNRDVYLEIAVGAETLTPRQQIATVGYALNSETLQGYPASAAATINTVPVIDNSGNINIAVTSPSIISSAGTFTVQGQVLSLKTGTNSGGDVIFQPDALGSGQILALGGTTTEDSYRVTNANLTSGSLFSGYVGNDTATGRLISLTAGSTETDRFWVATDGRAYLNTNATNSAFIVNQSGTGNLFSASASGVPKFTLNNAGIISLLDGVAHTIDDVGGNLTLTSNSSTISLNDSVTFASTTTLNSQTYTWPASQTTNYVLQTNGSGTLSWVAQTAAGGSNWTIASGAIYPINTTLDAFIGGTATTSAKFAFINVNSGTPTASVSGSVAGYATYLTGDGTLSTANNRSLALNPNGGNVGVGTTAPLQTLHVVGQCVTGDTLLRRKRRKKKRRRHSRAGGNPPDWEWEDVRIDEIAEGDEILTLDEKTGKFVTQKIKGLMDMGTQETYLLITESGKQIRTTAQHPYFVRDTKETTIIGGTYQVDQSPRIETLTKDSFVAIANKNVHFVIKISKEYKKSIHIEYQKQNKGRFFAPDLFAKAITTILTTQHLLPARLEIDHEYAGSESRITQIIKLVNPKLDVHYKSVGHSASSFAHWAAYQTFKGESKPTLTIHKKDRDTLKGVGLGAVTLIPLNQIRNTRDLLANREYHQTLDLSRNAVWKKVSELKIGMQIATLNGWETIIVLKKFSREQVYDIEVENTHNFVGNGLVAHNTYINSTATTANVKGLEIAQSGAITGTGYGLYVAKTGASTTNVGGYFSASGATNNYGLIVENGNVGIGDTTPAATLTVGSGDLFQVAGASGDITTAGDLNVNGDNINADGTLAILGATGLSLQATTGTITLDSIAASQILNIGASNVARTVNIGTGTGIDTIHIGDGATGADVITIGGGVGTLAINTGDWDISTTGVITNSDSYNGLVVTANTGVITTGTWNGTLIPLAYGGTNKNMTAVNGGVVWTDTDSMEVSAAGVAGQILKSNGAAAPSWIDASTLGGTNQGWTWAAGVLYPTNITDAVNLGNAATASATVHLAGVAGDNSFINTGNVGIGTTAPGAKLDIVGGLNVSGTSQLSDGYVTAGLYYLRLSSSTSLQFGTDPDFSMSSNGTILNLTSASTSRLAIDKTSGNVGIGTTGPTGKLTVVGPDDTTGIAFDVKNNSGSSKFTLDDYGQLSNNPYVTWSGSGVNVLSSAGRLAVTSVTSDYAFKVNQTSTGDIAQFQDNGTSVMVIKDGGNVGIGTVAPLGRLHLKGSGTTTAFTFRTQDSAGTDRFVIQDSGNVGIGTTSPLYAFDVVSTGTQYLRHKSTTSNNFGWNINRTMVGGTYDTDWYIYVPINSKDLTIFDTVARVTIQQSTGNVGIGTTSPTNAALEVVTSGTYGLGISGAKRVGLRSGAGFTGNILDLYADPSSGAVVTGTAMTLTSTGPYNFTFQNNGSTRMVIDSSGNVGIGTTGPGYAFHLQKSVAGANLQAVVENTNTTGIANIRTINNAGTIAQMGIYGATATAYGAISSGDSYFYSNSTGFNMMADNANGVIKFSTGGNVEKVRITNAGNVGIGTTAPSTKLQVAGTVSPSVTSSYDLGTSSLYWNNLYVNNVIGPSSGTQGYWQRNSGALSPTNITDDLLVGATATSSALVKLPGISGGNVIFNSGGNVGIGTTNPGAKLEVAIANGASMDEALRLNALNNGSNIGTYLAFHDAAYSPDAARIGAFREGASQQASLSFYTRFNNTTINEKMRLSGLGGLSLGSSYVGTDPGAGNMIISGNVGIGTTVPGRALEVYNALPLIKYNRSGFYSWEAGVDDGTYAGTSKFIIRNVTDNIVPLTIDIAGNVGIGTTAPGNKLDVWGITRISRSAGTYYGTIDEEQGYFDLDTYGSGTGYRFFIAGSEKVSIDNSGNVGIGTTGPATKLHVQQAAYDTEIARFQSTTAGNHWAGIGVDAAGTFWGTNLYVDGTRLFALKSNGGILIGTTVGTTTEPPANGMLISGNVGIGTTAPTNKLQVEGGNVYFKNTVTGATQLRLSSVGSGVSAGFLADDGAGGEIFSLTRQASNTLSISAYGDVGLASGATGGPSTSYGLILKSGGNVGIGTTAPTAKLDVAGDASVSASFVTRSATPTFDVLNGANLTFQTSPGGDTGLVAKMTLLNSGNVGIGTTSPGSPLHVAGGGQIIVQGDQNAIRYKDAGGTDRFLTGLRSDIAATTNYVFYSYGGDWIFNSGNVGIGTTAPNTKLEIAAGTTGHGLRITNTNTNSGIELVTSATTYSWLVGANNFVSNAFEIAPSTAVGGTTFTTPVVTILQSGNVGIGTSSPESKLQIDGSVYLNSGNTIWGRYQNSASNYGDLTLRAGNITSGKITGIKIYGTDNNATFTDSVLFKTVDLDRMIVNSSGNVGIGTTGPTVKLSVTGDAHNVIRSVGSTSGRIQLGHSGATTGERNFDIRSADGRLRFSSVSDDWSAFVTDSGMVMDKNGNVGIGTVSPTGKLDIVGSQNFTAFTAPGALTAGTPTTGGSCTAGTHSYKVTFTSVGAGETTAGTVSSVITCVLTSGQTVPLSAIPTGPAGTTGRKVYRTVAGDTGSYLLLTTIADNTTTIYSDTTADGSLGAAAPVSNTTAVANIQTGGTTKMIIDNSGNVGIGTTGPAGTLDVNGSIYLKGNSILESDGTNHYFKSPSYLYFQSGGSTAGYISNGFNLVMNGSGTFGTNAVINGGGVSYLNGGNVGIGTTSPGGILHTYGTNSSVYVSSSAATSNPFGTAFEGLRLQNSSNTDGTAVGILLASGTSSNGQSYIAGIQEADTLGALAFGNRTGATAYSEAMRITSAGNVGIGTTSPTSKLHVMAGASATSTLWGLQVSNEIEAQTWTGGAGIKFQHYLPGTTNQANKWAGVSSVGEADYSAKIGLAFYTNSNTANAPTEKVRINNAGNVGIGTTSPSQKLHVVGNCVTGDTILPIRRRRRRKSNGLESDDDENLDNLKFKISNLKSILNDLMFKNSNIENLDLIKNCKLKIKNYEAELERLDCDAWDYLLCRIDEILPGDEVLSLNESTEALEYSKINKLMDMGIHEVYELTTKSGRVIRTTANHPYLTLISSLPCQGEVASRPEGFI